MSYCIKENYQHREIPDFDDERGKTDECQDEVYQYAARLPDVASVLDVGCGGGFKLLKYFGDKKTLGIDLPATVEWLRTTYPDRLWLASGETFPVLRPDLIVCADVIEHLGNPNALLTFIGDCQPKWIVLSTPDRDLMQGMFQDGPPKNLCHCREWNGPEFRAYIERHFEVLEHHIPHGLEPSTQYLLAKIRA